MLVTSLERKETRIPHPLKSPRTVQEVMGYPGRAGNIQNELGSEVAVKESA